MWVGCVRGAWAEVPVGGGAGARLRGVWAVGLELAWAWPGCVHFSDKRRDGEEGKGVVFLCKTEKRGIGKAT